MSLQVTPFAVKVQTLILSIATLFCFPLAAQQEAPAEEKPMTFRLGNKGDEVSAEDEKKHAARLQIAMAKIQLAFDEDPKLMGELRRENRTLIEESQDAFKEEDAESLAPLMSALAMEELEEGSFWEDLLAELDKTKETSKKQLAGVGVAVLELNKDLVVIDIGILNTHLTQSSTDKSKGFIYGTHTAVRLKITPTTTVEEILKQIDEQDLKIVSYGRKAMKILEIDPKELKRKVEELEKKRKEQAPRGDPKTFA